MVEFKDSTGNHEEEPEEAGGDRSIYASRRCIVRIDESLEIKSTESNSHLEKVKFFIFFFYYVFK